MELLQAYNVELLYLHGIVELLSKFLSMEDQLVIFLYIVGHNNSNWQAENRFQLSWIENNFKEGQWIDHSERKLDLTLLFHQMLGLTTHT